LYRDCAVQIKRALSDPTSENDRNAWDAVKVAATSIKKFYQLSKSIDDIFPGILKDLAADDEKSLNTQKQALCKRFAQILDFTLKFDETKILKPGLMNDLSYYRRSLVKHSDEAKDIIRDDEASFIQLFIAQPSPIMYALAKTTSKELQNTSSAQVLQVLATMANVCLYLAKSKKYSETNTMLCLRAMVGCIVLFDHVSKDGAFVSPGINTKQAVMLVVKEYPQCHSLVSALKFTTIHYQDESTPSSVKTLLDSI